MNEVYTCVCGGQKWKVYDNGVIDCIACGKMEFIRHSDGKFETAKDFNKRMKLIVKEKNY